MKPDFNHGWREIQRMRELKRKDFMGATHPQTPRFGGTMAQVRLLKTEPKK